MKALAPRKSNEHSLVLSSKDGWPAALTLDIALEIYTLDELLLKYNLTEAELDNYYRNQHFRRELIERRAELVENGGRFKANARTQAETYLQVMDDLMNNPDVSPATKVSIWQSMVKYAELEPKRVDGGANGNSGITFNVQINA